MIRLHVAHIVFLATCLCLLQGGLVLVYSEGVSINFDSLSIHGVTLSNQIWGYQTTTPPAVTSTSATSMPGSTGTQNVNQNSINTVTSVSTNSSVSNQFQQSTVSNTQNNNLFQNHELTSGLIRTPNFNSLSEEPLLPQAESYAVTVCLSYNDMTAAGCADKKTPAQASEKLTSMMLNKYFKGIAIRPFRVVMPASVPSDQQIQLLHQIETEAIVLIETTLLGNLKNSKRFALETDAGKKQMKNIIIQDAQRAREEADKGTNWLHNSKDDRTSHNFQTAKAFRQFNNNFSIADLKTH